VALEVMEEMVQLLLLQVLLRITAAVVAAV
jgi:hypothetical protein